MTRRLAKVPPSLAFSAHPKNIHLLQHIPPVCPHDNPARQGPSLHFYLTGKAKPDQGRYHPISLGFCTLSPRLPWWLSSPKAPESPRVEIRRLPSPRRPSMHLLSPLPPSLPPATDRHGGEVTITGGSLRGRGKFWWTDEVLNLCHVAFQTAMGQPEMRDSMAGESSGVERESWVSSASRRTQRGGGGRMSRASTSNGGSSNAEFSPVLLLLQDTPPPKHKKTPTQRQ